MNSTDKCIRQLKKIIPDIPTKDMKGFVDEVMRRAKYKSKVEDTPIENAFTSSMTEVRKELSEIERQSKYSIILQNKINEDRWNQIKNYKDVISDGLPSLTNGTAKRSRFARKSLYATKNATQVRFVNKLKRALLKENALDSITDSVNEYELARAISGASVENVKNQKAGRVIRDLYKQTILLLRNYGSPITTLSDFISSNIHNKDKMLSPTGSPLKDILLKEKLMRKHAYDFVKVRREYQHIAKNRWKKFTVSRLDSRTFSDYKIHYQDDKKINKFLDKSYDNIVKEQFGNTNSLDPLKQDNERISYAEMIAQRRKLHFTPDGVVEYSREYGAGNLRENIVATLEKAARDLSLMKIFGPHYTSGWNYLVRKASEDAKKKLSLSSEAIKWKLLRQQTIFDAVTPRGEKVASKMLAKIGSSLRLWTALDRLGNLLAISLPDINQGAELLTMAGVSRFKAFSSALRGFTRVASKDARLLGERLNVTSKLTTGFMGTKFLNVDNNLGILSRMQGLFYSLNLAKYFDESNRESLIGLFSKELAQYKDREFSKLPDLTQEQLNRYGIGKNEWNIIKKASVPTYQNHEFILDDGLEILSNEEYQNYINAKLEDGETDIEPLLNKDKKLSPPQIIQVKEDLQDRLSSMYHDMAGLINMQLDPQAETFLMRLGYLQKGTPAGEFFRFFGQFKYFNARFVSQSLAQYLDSGGVRGKAANAVAAARFIALATGFGYLSLQASSLTTTGQLINTDDATPEQLKNIFLQSFSRGGGGGYFFSWLMNLQGDRNKLIGLFKPAAADNIFDAIQAMQFWKTDWGKHMTDFLAKDVPFTNIPYIKHVWQGLILHSMIERYDPGLLTGYKQYYQRQYNAQRI